MKATRGLRKLLVPLLIAGLVGGCSFFKKEATKEIEKVVEPKGGQEPQNKPEPTHEGPLLDNKVTAMRVQDALRQAGPAFQQVTVEGTKEEVVLSGTVKSAAERNRAEEIAKSVHRKMKLKNELKIAK
ncbi:BON domain-containing protein [Geomesophilobacter sediminis]|uniref:BON domain-containing protein n=1 Tax=Geomesophilobacter sediminis TaxID=2798584 RepID=A0A8J7S8T3_9BACT|nr:BON domain-containing protein [Geomesophilobacter sediminis]MBJ6727841.1 BON domain-containing protein [Geomesophilobacter sediminis]